jgi:hypothetical protein
MIGALTGARVELIVSRIERGASYVPLAVAVKLE